MTSHRLLPMLLGCALAACTGSATVTSGPGPAHPMPEHHAPPPPPSRPIFDSTGWVLLGSQPANGRVDRDVFRVNQRARYDKLTMVVYDSDLELLDFVVHFANGEKWSPNVKHVFREGQRSRQIDLPGDDRHITEIDLVYKNLPGGGNARVEIYGKDVKNVAHHEPPPPPPPPPPAEPAWDSAGWALLGSQTVDDAKKDVDVYKVNPKNRYDRVTIVVKNADLEMFDIIFTFANGDKYEPKLAHYFKEGQRTRQIDLPGVDRHIKEIRAKYRNTVPGHKAIVEIYGKDTREGADPGQRGGKEPPRGKNKDEAKDPKDPKYKPKK